MICSSDMRIRCRSILKKSQHNYHLCPNHKMVVRTEKTMSQKTFCFLLRQLYFTIFIKGNDLTVPRSLRGAFVDSPTPVNTWLARVSLRCSNQKPENIKYK